MANISMEQYTKNLQGAIADFDRFALDFLNTEAQSVVNGAKLRTPVDTGMLRNSHIASKATKRGNNYQAEISNSQEYASFIEDGTVRGIKPYFMQKVPLEKFQIEKQAKFDKAFKLWAKKRGIE